MALHRFIECRAQMWSLKAWCAHCTYMGLFLLSLLALCIASVMWFFFLRREIVFTQKREVYNILTIFYSCGYLQEQSPSTCRRSVQVVQSTLWALRNTTRQQGNLTQWLNWPIYRGTAFLWQSRVYVRVCTVFESTDSLHQVVEHSPFQEQLSQQVNHINQNLLDIEKEIVRDVARGDEHQLRKSAD